MFGMLSYLIEHEDRDAHFAAVVDCLLDLMILRLRIRKLPNKLMTGIQQPLGLAVQRDLSGFAQTDILGMHL
jgi:hypothetical protein